MLFFFFPHSKLTIHSSTIEITMKFALPSSSLQKSSSVSYSTSASADLIPSPSETIATLPPPPLANVAVPEEARGQDGFLLPYTVCCATFACPFVVEQDFCMTKKPTQPSFYTFEFALSTN